MEERLSDRLPQAPSPLGWTSRRGLLSRAVSRLAVAVGGGSVASGLGEALARNGANGGRLGGRHGKNKRGRHHKHKKHKNKKHRKGAGSGAGCRNESQCNKGQTCCPPGKCID